MKYLKKYEKEKPIYPTNELQPFIDWFYRNFEDEMSHLWLISYAETEIPYYIDIQYKNRIGIFWQVQKNDQSDLLESDEDAEKLAKELGLMIDDYGIIIGFKGVNFLENPEEIDFYKNIQQYNL